MRLAALDHKIYDANRRVVGIGIIRYQVTMSKLLFLIFSLAFSPILAFAQELHTDVQNIWRAEVSRVVVEENRKIPGTEAETLFQLIEARILEGAEEGRIVRMENDFLKLEEGEHFFLSHIRTVTGEEYYTVFDADRRGTLLFLAAAFVLSIVLIGGRQGLRSILSLLGSFFIILYALVPALLAGFPPVPTSVILASLILVVAIFATHGVNRLSLVALGGTIGSVALTGLIAYFSVQSASLTGFAIDEAVYLNFGYPGLDFQGLLLGGIIIGILGVLDDVSVTQAAVVRELYSSSPNLSTREVYTRALKVGREHVGALVNTLALAYVGTSLPLLLLFSGSEAPAWTIINREIFASEIVRTAVGSIGLILTVPLTTLLAAIFLKKENGRSDAPTHFHHHHH